MTLALTGHTSKDKSSAIQMIQSLVTQLGQLMQVSESRPLRVLYRRLCTVWSHNIGICYKWLVVQ
jgi:hypothetical protein